MPTAVSSAVCRAERAYAPHGVLAAKPSRPRLVILGPPLASQDLDAPVGLLTVRVQRADRVPKVDLFSQADPYVECVWCILRVRVLVWAGGLGLNAWLAMRRTFADLHPSRSAFVVRACTEEEWVKHPSCVYPCMDQALIVACHPAQALCAGLAAPQNRGARQHPLPHLGRNL